MNVFKKTNMIPQSLCITEILMQLLCVQFCYNKTYFHATLHGSLDDLYRPEPICL